MSRASDFTPYKKPAARAVSVGVRTVEGGVRRTPAERERARLLVAAEGRAKFGGDDDAAYDDTKEVLAALGLTTREGSVLVRFREDDSQVRLYVDPDGELRCQWCPLQAADYVTTGAADMLEHLHQHRLNGHIVPWWAEQRVEEVKGQ